MAVLKNIPILNVDLKILFDLTLLEMIKKQLILRYITTVDPNKLPTV